MQQRAEEEDQSPVLYSILSRPGGLDTHFVSNPPDGGRIAYNAGDMIIFLGSLLHAGNPQVPPGSELKCKLHVFLFP